MLRNYSSLQARSTVFESVCACAEGGGGGHKKILTRLLSKILKILIRGRGGQVYL